MNSLIVLCACVAVTASSWAPYSPYGPPAHGHGAPAPVQDTPEVAAAKAAHFAALSQASAHSQPSHYSPGPAYSHPSAAAPPPVNGVPQDTPEVAAAKAAHFAAVAKAGPSPYAPAPSHYAPQQYAHAHAPAGGYPAAPAPINGVPQDTPEVAAAKAAHFAAVARNGAPAGPAHYQAPHAPAPYHPTPAQWHNPQWQPAHHEAAPAVPQDTPEVAAAKAAHFAAVAKASAGPHSPNHWA